MLGSTPVQLRETVLSLVWVTLRFGAPTGFVALQTGAFADLLPLLLDELSELLVLVPKTWGVGVGVGLVSGVAVGSGVTVGSGVAVGVGVGVVSGSSTSR